MLLVLMVVGLAVIVVTCAADVELML